MSNKWYCHVNLKPQGPFSLEELRAKVYKGEVGPQDLICDETNAWKPALEWGVFEVQLFPASQGFIQGAEILDNVREWVLLAEQAAGVKPLQEGPFTVTELRESLTNGNISPYQYVWKTGMSGWCQLKDRPEFSNVISSERLSDPSLA